MNSADMNIKMRQDADASRGGRRAMKNNELYCSGLSSIKTKQFIEATSLLKERLLANIQRAMDLVTEKRASSWFTTLPMEEHGFTLHTGPGCFGICS